MATPQKVLYPDINGNRYSGNSAEVLFNGLVFRGFKKLSYSDALEPGDVYGASPEKIGRTRGKATAEASFDMYKEEFENLRATLGAGGVGYMEVEFPIVATYFELLQVPITDTILGCRITKVDDAVSTDSAEALAVTVKLNVMRILRGGLDRSTYPFPTL